MSDYGYQPPPGGGGFGAPGAPPYSPPPQMTPLLTVSQLFRDTGAVLSGRFLQFALIAGGFTLPSIVSGMVFAVWQNKLIADAGGGLFALTAIPGWFTGLNMVSSIITYFIAYLGIAVMTIGAVDHLIGQRRGTSELLSSAISHAPSIIGISFLHWLLSIVIAVPVVIVITISALTGPIGVLCCCTSSGLGGFAAWCGVFAILFVSVPACVIERLGPIEAMSRSANTTRGHRQKLTGVNALFFLGLFAVAVPFVCCIGGAQMSSYDFTNPQAMMTNQPLSTTLLSLGLLFFLQVLGYMVSATLSAAAYVRLTGANQRTDGATVAAVFQ